MIGKRVAIKVLNRSYSADPHVLSRFIAEARAVNQIRHRNIVDIFSFGELEDGRRYFVMEFLDGLTLESYLRQRGRLEIAEALAILEPLARALDAAHEAGIAHRDLKPANVIITKGDEGELYPKLLDFGIAKLLSDEIPRSHRTKSGVAVGTPEYMSPEQVEGTGVDHRTDAYSFGVICFRMLTGRLPFTAANNVEMMIKHLREPPPPLRSIEPRIPKTVDQLVLSLLEKDREKRSDPLVAWVQSLRAAASNAPTAPETGMSFADTMPPMRMMKARRLWIGLTFVLLLLTAIAAALLLRQMPPGDPVATPSIAQPPPAAPPPATPPPATPVAAPPTSPPPPIEAVKAPKAIKKPAPSRQPKTEAPAEDNLLEWEENP